MKVKDLKPGQKVKEGEGFVVVADPTKLLCPPEDGSVPFTTPGILAGEYAGVFGPDDEVELV